jgi:hypothetical protein
LPEGPARELSTLLPSSPHPQAYARQIFEGDCSLRAFGKLNNLFADYVVRVAGESLLLARELLKAAFCGVRAFLLQFRPESPVTVSDGVDGSATTDVAVRVYRYVLDFEIYADDTFGHERLWVLDFAGGEEVELTASVYEIGFPRAGFEQIHLSLAGHKRDALPGVAPTSNGPDGHGWIIEVPRKNAVVVGDGAMRLEAPLAPLIQPVGISNLGKAAHDHLSREPEARLHVPIAELLKRVLPESPPFPSLLGDAVASGVGKLERLFQEVRLLLGWAEFQLGYELHVLKVYLDYGGFPMNHLLHGSDCSSPLKGGLCSEQLR